MVRGSLLLLAVLAGFDARAETIVVNLNSDEPDAEPSDGVSDVDPVTPGLQVTLRAAIEHANTTTGSDEIRFALASPTITPAADLPEVMDTLSIDGALPGAIVRLQARGIVLSGAGCAIRNLAITMAPYDAIVSYDRGPLSLENIELTQSAGGFGVRARGSISIDGGLISENVKGGALSSEGIITGTSLVIEANGGPGIMALSGIELVTDPIDPVRIRSNGGGLFTDGFVALFGDGLHQISGNFGDGIRALGPVTGGSDELEILDNASFGVRAGGNVKLGGSADVSGNGHGLFAIAPDAIELTPTFSTLMGEAVRGGGVLSAAGQIEGSRLVANDNAAPGLISEGPILFSVVEASRNDGHGIQSAGDVSLGGARLEGNFGAGILTTGRVEVNAGAIISDNASSGLLCRAALITGDKSEINRNGKLDRSTSAAYDSALAVAFEANAPLRAGAIATVSFRAVNVEVDANGGDGISTDWFVVTDSAVTNNEGVGLLAVTGGTLTRTLLCDNGGGDLVAGNPVELIDSAACDLPVVQPEEGCGCTSTARGSGSAIVLLFALLFFVRRRVLLQLLCFGCGAEQAFFAPPPPPESAKSVVFAIESEDAVKLEARAIDEDGVPPVTIEFDRLGRSEVWTLYYDRELSAHGLAEGTVRVLPEGSPLDSPDRIHRAEFLGGELSAWSIEPVLSDRMQSLEVEREPPPSPCIELGEERIFPLAAHRDGAFALRVDGDRALIATTDAALYLVTIDGVTPLGKAVPVKIESGHLSSNGELIVGGTGGRTFRGPIEPELRLVEIARGASGDAFRWMDGPKEGAISELFAVTSSGALEHFDGARWSMLFPPDGEDWRRGVAWVGPSEAIAVGLSAPIVRATDGLVEEEPVDAVDAFTSVEHVAGLGTFAGTLAGTILSNRGAGWEPIAAPPFNLPATAIAPVAGGIIVSGGTGQSAVWLPDYGFCEHLSVNSPIVKHLAVLDRAVVFLGDARDNTTDPTSVSVVLFR